MSMINHCQRMFGNGLIDSFDINLFDMYRNFYEKQLRLIKSIESILVPKTYEEVQERILRDAQQQQQVRILINITLIINIVRYFLKLI